MNKELFLKSINTKNHLDDNIDVYIKEAFRCADTMFLYRTLPFGLGKNNRYSWIKTTKHAEYDKLIINSVDERYSSEYCPKKDKCVYAFDLNNQDVKDVLKKEYRFPIGWAVGDYACKIKSDDFFSDDPEYDGYNVLFTRGDKILLDGDVHVFNILIDSSVIKGIDRKKDDYER